MKTYLALGDSYTVGEQVPVYENFPNQLVQLLRKRGLPFTAPEIVAKTGWTTGELKAGMAGLLLLEKYDLVTLLIGVNNQYRGYTTEEYAADFEWLLEQAIHYAGGRKENLIVLSIPDWSVTPFAASRNRRLVAMEIATFNDINQRITVRHGIKYADITPGTRNAADDPGLLTEDGLHPSARAYAGWAEQLNNMI